MTFRYTEMTVLSDDTRLPMYTRTVSLFLAVACLAPGIAGAQDRENAAINYDTARAERRLTAAQEHGPIALDGRLDEPSWAAAPIATNFVQNDPREGEPGASADLEDNVPAPGPEFLRVRRLSWPLWRL